MLDPSVRVTDRCVRLKILFKKTRERERGRDKNKKGLIDGQTDDQNKARFSCEYYL